MSYSTSLKNAFMIWCLIFQTYETKVPELKCNYEHWNCISVQAVDSEKSILAKRCEKRGKEAKKWGKEAKLMS